MIKTPINLQDLRRRIYVKAKAEPAWRFWGLYVHVCKMETLREAYEMAKKNNGAPGIDGVTFEAIEAQRRGEPSSSRSGMNWSRRTYRPHAERRQEIPKDGGKVRVLSIPGHPRPGGPGGAQAHLGADLRGGLPTGVVWIPSQADCP